jgi:hypothetical protein
MVFLRIGLCDAHLVFFPLGNQEEKASINYRKLLLKIVGSFEMPFWSERENKRREASFTEGL